jgi:Uma2 family endonuclease
MTTGAYRVKMAAGGANMVLVDSLEMTSDDVHRFTVDEYLALAVAFDWERRELLDGVVYDMAAQYDLHGGTVVHVFRQLDRLFPHDKLRISSTVRLGRHSAPEPDVYVVDGSVDYDRNDVVPGELVKLVVEVSVTSQAKDLGVKLRIYAEHGVPQYWVIDPRKGEGWLRRYTRPVDGEYRAFEQFDVGVGAEQLDAAAVLAGA